jgi:anti-sigma regulatory factor (Ser/Thr protein kinase)
MPYYACPNCGSSISSAADVAPAACPGCCALLHPTGELPRPAATLAQPMRPKPALRMPIGRDPGAPAAARRAIADLRVELGDARFRVCELLVSELVTNVLLHAPGRSAWGAADMRVRMYPDRVRIEVRDDGAGFSPHRRAPGQDLDSGWGLYLVAEMADEWGTEPGLQNCVWFELARTPLPSGMHAAVHH